MKIKAVILCASFFILNCWIASAADAPKPLIKIGVSAILSGDRANFGQDFVQAAQMAVDDYAPQMRNRYQLIIDDNAFDNKKAALSGRKMIDVDHVNGFLAMWDVPAFVLGPIAEKEQMPLLCVGYTAEVTKAKTTFVCYTWPHQMADKLADYIAKRGFKKIAIIQTNYRGNNDLCQTLTDDLIKLGCSVVSSQKFTDGTRDYRTIIAKAADTNPDLYFVCAISPDIDLLVRQLKETNTKSEICSLDTVEETPEKKLFEGIWYVAAAVPTKEFQNRYFEKFHTNHIISFSVFGYEAMHMLMDAFEHASLTTSNLQEIQKGAVDYLNHLGTFQGVTGEIKPVTDRYFSSEPVMKIFHNGNIELLPLK